MARANEENETTTEKSVSDEEGSPAQTPVTSSSALTSRATRLNPNAQDWDIAKERSSRAQRCLYLTFSNSQPFCESEISEFFNNVFGDYGPCVESVHVIRPKGNSPPVEGKVIFCFMSVPMRVMAGREEAKYEVNGKTLSCKWFKRRRD